MLQGLRGACFQHSSWVTVSACYHLGVPTAMTVILGCPGNTRQVTGIQKTKVIPQESPTLGL